jgi:hypothetical protein
MGMTNADASTWRRHIGADAFVIDLYPRHANDSRYEILAAVRS